MKYRFIDQEKTHHPVSRLARVLGVTRAGYYAWKKRPPSRRAIEDEALGDHIERIFEQSRCIYGAPRIRDEFVLGMGVAIGCKRIARLMRERGIVGISGREGKRRPPKVAAECEAAPDLVCRVFKADGPNVLWLADITYIPTDEGWVFLAAVMDMWSRKIVGWSMADTLHADIVVDALSMAVTLRRPDPGVIHHSDRGSQYRSLVFGRTLRDSGLVASMGSRGDAYDNAATESLMATIKKELVNRMKFKTRDHARLEVFSYIERFYNTHRRHSNIGKVSPVEFEAKMAEGNQAATAA
jgi:putative transposase